MTEAESKILYYGDNGKHEFWENAHSDGKFPKLLILRNHGEECWSAHKDYCFVDSSPSMTIMVEKLGATYSERKVWKQFGCVYRLVDADTAKRLTKERFSGMSDTEGRSVVQNDD